MQALAYTPFERLAVGRPVDRLDFISQAVANKQVLDLGAYDETAFDKKGPRYWLHGRMAETATYVYGVDSSAKLPESGLTTSATSRILKGSLFALQDLVDLETIEVVVAGELIEHLPDTLAFLRYLKSLPALQGKPCLLSTPNAACLSNFCLGLCRMENNDLNHLQVYSAKTLHTLFQRADFADWQLIPYHEIFPEMIDRSSGWLKVATVVFQKSLHLGEALFPAMSGGWLAAITI